MIRITVYSLLVLFSFQTIGYFTFAKKALINKVISKEEVLIDLNDILSVKINTNFVLTANQKKKYANIFRQKKITYRQFKIIDDLIKENLFEINELNFTIDNSEYIFPTAIIGKYESIEGFGANDEYLYFWVLFTWIKVKNLSGGIS